MVIGISNIPFDLVSSNASNSYQDIFFWYSTPSALLSEFKTFSLSKTQKKPFRQRFWHYLHTILYPLFQAHDHGQSIMAICQVCALFIFWCVKYLSRFSRLASINATWWGGLKEWRSQSRFSCVIIHNSEMFRIPYIACTWRPKYNYCTHLIKHLSDFACN